MFPPVWNKDVSSRGAPCLKVMETSERGNNQLIDSFTLINNGGDYSFKAVVILGAR